MKQSLITAIAEHLLGRKYYANVTFTRGSDDTGLSYHIFRSRADARAHAAALASNRSYGHLETVTFRSRRHY